MKTNKLKLAIAESGGFCPSYIKALKHKSDIIVLQFKESVRGGWVMDHDDNEWLIYKTNCLSECWDSVTAKNASEALLKAAKK